MENAPLLASIHDGNMLGGDAKGAPPVPTLARTLALAQAADSGPHRAHRRCIISRLIHHTRAHAVVAWRSQEEGYLRAARRWLVLQRSAQAYDTQGQLLHAF